MTFQIKTHWNESKTACTFITHNDEMSLTWDISESEMEECIREVEKANWKEVHTIADDTNSGMKQLLYVFEEPFSQFSVTNCLNWMVTLT